MASVIALEQYRQQLLAAFPPKPFHGFLTTHGDCCDDGRHLVNKFAGRAWPEIAHDDLFHGSIAIHLLEPDALVAFLPAWLLRAMEITLRESEPLEFCSQDFTLVEFTLYFLCPHNCDDVEDVVREHDITERINHFDTAQRKAVAALLQAVHQCPEGDYLVDVAALGIPWWPPTS